MKKLKFYLQAIFIPLVVGSCSLEDHPPQPSCTYQGYFQVQESYNGAVKNVFNDDYNIDQTSDHHPKKISALRTYVRRDTARGLDMYTSTDSDQSIFTYNDGYLMQITRTDVTEQQSETDDIFFLQYRTKKLHTETSETTDFRYENGMLQEVSFKQTVAYTTSNLGTITTTLTNKKVYQYDSQGHLKALIFTESTGWNSITNYENGLITSITGNNMYGPYTETFEYKDGLTKKITNSDGSAQEFTYDQKGNLTLIYITKNDIKRSQYQYWYDDSPRPGSSISITYKGIPTPWFITGTPQNRQRYDEVNNPVKIETTSWETQNLLIATINLTYTYNANKYPSTQMDSWNNDNGVNRGFTKLTYKYTDCP
ncbi:YD repeat-containing protein [Dyadobacter sp. BE34]|uniref:YD repeat-containing protein n=1 Tax=Dyadobacter fermentans TaxID=94254 RepID=A0ABU1QPX1_9BACT|nr:MULTISPECIES: hypothetical protein [Dyadobacter]MDR6803204.1 YD repeat-containing protein [Dyadobacter fermentans]MDR7040945.1 YD repeat-containing protein [Dyadobacter sp. BE242]MDR7195348.1 YD repeat-containing protein [Dyadobacter sp. BE34]MDR7214106.1 YD repeat-containing protein [Dyadobacter sp. BE31]MDR7260755.1 YD repeat-containing protein [Dyadobacter sp. BE32]